MGEPAILLGHVSAGRTVPDHTILSTSAVVVSTRHISGR
jgi:hypothetical protein